MNGTVIGILGNTFDYSNSMYQGVEKQYVNSRYVTAVEQNGGVPLLIPYLTADEKLYRLLDLCDGLLFPGGEDVDPGNYGEEPHSRLGEIKPEIDKFLIKAIRYAIEKEIPSMGICKGMQMMVVVTGGSLYQDMYHQREEESYLHCQYGKRDYELHTVEIEKDTHLYGILGTDSIRTNSMHHQSVKNTGNIMRVSAKAGDGVIEAMESSDGLFIGVQWHPEEMIDSSEKMNLLFKNLVERAAK